jgi:hypothetical protein
MREGPPAERRVTARPGRLGGQTRAFALSAARSRYLTTCADPKKMAWGDPREEGARRNRRHATGG